MTAIRSRARPARARGRVLVVVLAALVAVGCERPAGRAEVPGFPAPDRPVARIISPAYSDEVTRDARGEAERVLDALGIRPGLRVADTGAGDGYYTVRLARRLGSGGTLYATDVEPEYLARLEARLKREGVVGVRLVRGAPRDPRLPPASIDLALLSHVYHEIENPFEFFYRLQPAFAPGGRVAIIDVDKPTGEHGTPPALLRCELAAVGYRELEGRALAPADGYLATFAPPAERPRVEAIRPCRQ